MDTTWDGVAIAPDWPTGATVVVRRPDGEVLLLHRAKAGASVEGPWVWTAPAGARQPGESLLGGALRELAEEAGLTDIDITPVDLSGHWALFTAEVSPEMPVTLVDVEHDTFEWVRPSEAYARVRPITLAGGIRRALGTSLTPIAFRPLQRADLPAMVTWQNAEHVRRWWDDAVADVDAAEKKYGPRIDGTSATGVDVILLDGSPVGFIQNSPLSADPDYFETGRWATDGGQDTVTIDYAIGEPSRIGQGLGTRVIWAYIRDVVLARFPGTRFVVADPMTVHAASIRACEKAGFRRMFDFDAEPYADPTAPRHAFCVWDRARVVGPAKPQERPAAR